MLPKAPREFYTRRGILHDRHHVLDIFRDLVRPVHVFCPKVLYCMLCFSSSLYLEVHALLFPLDGP